MTIRGAPGRPGRPGRRPGRHDSPWSPWSPWSPFPVIGPRAWAARHREESEPTACERPMIGERALLASPRFTGTAGPITAGDAPRPEGQGALVLRPTAAFKTDQRQYCRVDVAAMCTLPTHHSPPRASSGLQGTANRYISTQVNPQFGHIRSRGSFRS